MATSTIPVDLRNPGQVFACLGLMETAEALGLGEVEGGFDYTGADFDGWCRDAGFTATRIMPLVGPASAAIAYK